MKIRKSRKTAQTEAQQTTSAAPSPEVAQQVDEIVAAPSRQRVWEVDFVRGLMILFVVIDHFFFDVGYVVENYNTGFFQWLQGLSDAYYNSTVRQLTHDVFVTMFVLTSGVSCSFSRSNGKRALRMMVFSLLFTAVTAAVSAITHTNITIHFNVIHVITLSVACWTGLEWIWKKCKANWQKNLFGFSMAALVIAVLVVGGCAEIAPWGNSNKMFFFLVRHSGDVEGFSQFAGGDYLPFFPDFGWFLVGVFLGKLLYKTPQTLFPSVNTKYVAPITFCGRYSIWIYFGTQVVMYAFFWLFGLQLNWL